MDIERRTDHKGVVYPSIQAMCDAYSISMGTYRERINKVGWSKEKALTTPNLRITKDHIGNEYSTKLEMLRHYGISATTFTKRLKEGMSLEEALTVEVKTKYIQKDAYYDHDGNKFDSLTGMLAKYGLCKSLYYHRVSLGWSLKQILTTPIRSTVCIDFIGRKYKDLKEMCKYYKVGYNAYALRVKKGMSTEEALLLPSASKRYKDLGSMRIYKAHFTLKGVTYYKCNCLKCECELLLNAKDLVNHNCKEQKQKAA